MVSRGSVLAAFRIAGFYALPLQAGEFWFGIRPLSHAVSHSRPTTCGEAPCGFRPVAKSQS